MGVSFEYNLGELVSFGSRDLVLRRAVSEYVTMRKTLAPASSAALRWFREQGKKPSAFEINHMDQLAALPIFNQTSGVKAAQ